ncbi:MAG: Zn-ribbon domain-containing OB-fold protein [Candidatus Methanofastidiosia archaeon]
MEFLKFGKVGFVPYTKVGEFIEFLKAGRLMASKCEKCQKISFPPRSDCTCLSEDFSWIPLSQDATLISYTEIHVAPAGFEDEKPYSLGVAELTEGGRILAPLDVSREDIQIGMSLKVEIVESQDKIYYVLTKKEED